MTKADPIPLTPEQAMDLIDKDAERIHTFRDGRSTLVGGHFDALTIRELIRTNPCELGGPHCQAMGHALVIWTDRNDSQWCNPLFVEHKTGIDFAALEAALKKECNPDG